MSFFRVSNPATAAVEIFDLGVIIEASATDIVLSSQFGVQDMVRSSDLEALLIAGTLTVQIDYGTGFTTISPGSYTNRDCLGAFLNIYEITNENNSEDLVDGSDVGALHMHDGRYFTKTQMVDQVAALLIGANDTAWAALFNFSSVQGFIDGIFDYIGSGIDLDYVYDADTDGIMNVDGANKPLIFRSDASVSNDIVIQRFDTPDVQDFLRADISANELLLGALAVGSFPRVNVKVISDLIVDGNITFSGTITDTTVNELNVVNANIKMREGAAAGADASLLVERGSDGVDAAITWSEADDRWKAGLFGSERTIALLEIDENISGTWLFDPSPSSDPIQIWSERVAPSTGLGAVGQIPVSMFENGVIGVYDKSNGRNKWLSVDRQSFVFTGRSSPNNRNEYAYVGLVNSFETGIRIPKNKTLVGISAQANNSATWSARVRKNNVATNLATILVSAAVGAHSNTQNVDFTAGDEIQVYIDVPTGSVGSPVIKLEFADTLA